MRYVMDNFRIGAPNVLNVRMFERAPNKCYVSMHLYCETLELFCPNISNAFLSIINKCKDIFSFPSTFNRLKIGSHMCHVEDFENV